MSTNGGDGLFAGSIPKLYETYLVPLIFEPYAADLARRVGERPIASVLEIAAGTGVVTRAMAAALPESTALTATDLNQPMLDFAASRPIARAVEWRQADAMALPFQDRTFDAVVCQFGVMFFADRAKAYAEVRRVLKPGGRFLFSVWDRIEENEFADAVTTALEGLFPADPPRFLARTPHGYHDTATVMRDLKGGGFGSEAQIRCMSARSRAATPREPAIAYCQGTPLRNEIEARDPGALDTATDIAAKAIEARFGSGPVDGKIQAYVVVVAA
jgi:SAM-dependent methyltransferase